MHTKNSNSDSRQRGSILVTILLITTFLIVVLLGLLVLANANLHRARGRIMLLQAQYSAESGADVAIAALNAGNTAYTGSGGELQVLRNAQYRSTYSATVTDGNSTKEKIILATGRVYAPASSTTASYTRTIRVTAQRTSSSVASSIVSRNIIYIESGVKNIIGKDIYANGYILMNKNTTNIIAENIVVAGKNTGATNCSIGGTGNLIKPATFTTAGQTKTNLNLAFNNCISPPGNTSNSNFTVSVNQTNISTIQSTYIPWSQFMDSTYLSSVNGCADWTSGASPRSIPSTGNTKKTHYPDNGANIAATCGTSGDLSLGSNTFTINDNIHVRANMCAASACDPKFNNPTATMKYIFVEGTINFSSVNSVSGSGPITFIVYGADPASKTSVCPYGGAVYVGQSGSTTTAAPKVYFLAMNGICLDKTKFGASPALGGVGGKNIYIATNPGTPWDLALDPTFPVEQIPIDLYWRESLYERT